MMTLDRPKHRCRRSLVTCVARCEPGYRKLKAVRFVPSVPLLRHVELGHAISIFQRSRTHSSWSRR